MWERVTKVRASKSKGMIKLVSVCSACVSVDVIRFELGAVPRCSAF